MKKSIFLLTIFLLTFKFGQSQTNVSGGIYTSTTWTLANSPYIVTDTIVVFPGVTLTIQPGVEVKFNDNKVLIVRQGQILAVGTSNDTIKFTSNSTSPYAGIWDKIHINGGSLISQFEYCKIEYSENGIYNNHLNGNQNTTATLNIKNSEFISNIKAISAIGNGAGFTKIESSTLKNNNKAIYGSQYLVENCIISDNISGFFIEPFANTFSFINNSSIRGNQFGITGGATVGAAFYSIKNSIISCNTTAGVVLGGYPSYVDTIYNCLFKDNFIAVLDSFGSGLKVQKSVFEGNDIGLKLKNSNKQLYCNKLCNTTWDIYCKNSFSSNLVIPSNFWCTSDSSIISSKIYDGYDNFNLSLVNYMPLDASQCYSTGVLNPNDTTNCGTLAAIVDTLSQQTYGLQIYPNPFSTQTNLDLGIHPHNVTLTVSNYLGQPLKVIKNISEQLITLHRNNLPGGVYFIQLTQESQVIATKKVIIAD